MNWKKGMVVPGELLSRSATSLVNCRRGEAKAGGGPSKEKFASKEKTEGSTSTLAPSREVRATPERLYKTENYSDYFHRDVTESPPEPREY